MLFEQHKEKKLKVNLELKKKLIFKIFITIGFLTKKIHEFILKINFFIRNNRHNNNNMKTKNFLAFFFLVLQNF